MWATLLVNLILALAKILLPYLANELERRYESAEEDPAVTERLKKSARQHWYAPILLAAILAGCSPRTIYVPDGQPVKLRESVQAKVWVPTAAGPVASEMVIPEGWFALPDPGEGGGE